MVSLRSFRFSFLTAFILLLFLANRTTLAAPPQVVHPNIKNPPTLSVVSVSFSGTGNIPAETMGIAIPKPEYVANPLRNESAVYIKGSSPTLTIVVDCANGTYTGIINIAATYGSGANQVTLTASPATFNVSIPDGGSTTLVTTLSGMPNCVSSRDLALTTTYYPYMPSAPYNITTTHHLFQVFDTPQNPMHSPWVEVLADACGWADGYSTDAYVARYITTGLFFSGHFYYPGNANSYWTNPVANFHLTDFLNTLPPVRGNCVDVSDYLLICENAVGFAFQVGQHTDANTGSFTSNPLCPIGSNPSVYSSYAPYGWVMHQFDFSSTNTIYDACGAQWVDLSGNAFRNPPFNFAWPGFWQTILNGNILGVVNTPNPSTPHRIGGLYVPSVQ